MASQVYKTLAKTVGVILIVLGAAALIGANFARGFVSEQLVDQSISMPTTESINGQLKSGRIAEDDALALRPFAGQQMTTGDQARVFADHYIRAHMLAAAKAAGVPQDKANFSGIGALVTGLTNALKEELKALPDNASKSDQEIAALASKEMANPATTFKNAKDAAALQKLRMDTFLDGNTLRGMLLNAYGWWLVGTLAMVAGWVLIGIGLLMAGLGFLLKPKRAEASLPA